MATCKCKEIYEQKIAENRRNTAPANEHNHRAELTSYSLCLADLNSEMTLKPKLLVEIKYDRTNKAGISVAKTEKSFLVANFCPLCGSAIQ